MHIADCVKFLVNQHPQIFLRTAFILHQACVCAWDGPAQVQGLVCGLVELCQVGMAPPVRVTLDVIPSLLPVDCTPLLGVINKLAESLPLTEVLSRCQSQSLRNAIVISTLTLSH